jgi:hypothetical protein
MSALNQQQSAAIRGVGVIGASDHQTVRVARTESDVPVAGRHAIDHSQMATPSFHPPTTSRPTAMPHIASAP